MSVTIYDVARHAGVSPRTVSNVINEYPFVAAHTRQKVLDSIQVLGYRPNLTARNLRRGRTGMIALAVPELAVPYFSELSGAVMEEAARRSYTMIIEQTDGDQERERKLLADSEREQLFEKLVAAAYQHGKALRAATTFELDDVIDPSDSRTWITRLVEV